ncbi:MAG: hypothetical protein B6U78_02030 [Candidatus Aenigmarchaeota archaeon ex4484_224]|nr:MAG: hypothetical protein B6U78_02030 [Candidatus Aenigmarchaeota archaeon ex4484_224]
MDNAWSKSDKMKLKILPSSLREKKRYIKIEVLEEKIDLNEFEKKIKEIGRKIFGEFYFGDFSLKFVKNLCKNKFFVLRCSHLFVQHILFLLGFIEEINGKKIIIKVHKISGTLKSIKS